MTRPVASTLVLLSLLIRVVAAPPGRGGSTGLPAHAPARRRGGRGPRVCAVVPDLRSPALPALVCRLVDQVDRVVVAHAEDRDAAIRLADLDAHRAIEVVAVGGVDRTRGRISRAGVEHALARHGPDAVLIADPDGAQADAVPAFVAALVGRDVVLGDRTADPALPRSRRLRLRLPGLLLRLRFGRRVRDAGSPMCLLSAEALRRVLLRGDRRAGSVAHLPAMLACDLDVAWVPLAAARRRPVWWLGAVLNAVVAAGFVALVILSLVA